jgi:hypothetical protein
MKWYTCPICKKNLLKINSDKVIAGVFIKCRGCTRQIEVVNKPNKVEPEPSSLKMI